MIESLIALLVLAIALLGVASLQLLAQREEVEARWRSAAVSLSSDLLEQLRVDRVAAKGLAIENNVVTHCDGTNQWLCDLIAGWQASAAEQLPNVITQMEIDGQANEPMSATVSLVWQRVPDEDSVTQCRPQDGVVIDDGGCLRLETAL